MRKMLMIGAALAALAGCNRGQVVTQSEGPANVTVDTPNGSAVVRTGGGAMANLPEGIPAYPGADTSASVDVSGRSTEGQGRVLTFTTPDPPARVIDFYARAVGGAGYAIANQATMGPTAMLTAQKGPHDTVTITATQAGPATQVSLVVANDAR